MCVASPLRPPSPWRLPWKEGGGNEEVEEEEKWDEGGRGGRRRWWVGGLLCLLITRRRHICIHVRASPRLVALTFSLNVIVCNNLMPPVSLRPLLPGNFSAKSLRSATFLTVAPPPCDCLLAPRHRRRTCARPSRSRVLVLDPARVSRGANIHGREILIADYLPLIHPLTRPPSPRGRCRGSARKSYVSAVTFRIQMYSVLRLGRKSRKTLIREQDPREIR